MSDKITFALNMIVGPGEASDLDRCLCSFKAKEVFDEIVIVNTSNDKRVDEVIEKWGAKTKYHQWTSERYPYGDFAGARNAALDMTESTWVMWLDADDVCAKKEHREKLMKVRERVTSPEGQDADVFFMRYTLIVDEFGNELAPFMRDRIWKRGPRFRWVRPVHESITPPINTIQHGTINGVSIVHMPAKSGHASCVRNIAILEHEIKVMGDTSPEVRYFYARDLGFVGRVDDAIAETKKLLEERICPPDHMYSLCMQIAYWIGYGGGTPLRPAIDIVPEDKMVEVESWIRQALAIDSRQAEPFVLLADLYLRRGLVDQARKLYSLAMRKKGHGNRIVRIEPFYGELPAARLADTHAMGGEYDAALFYNRMAINANPNEPGYWNQRNSLVMALSEELAQKFSHAESVTVA